MSKMRYSTVGDYYNLGNEKQFRIAEMGNEDYEFLVLIHEMIEEYITSKRGISEQSIADFDIRFEKIRTQFPGTIGDQEPGHMTSAPYHREHVFAEKIERLIADELGVDWEDYDKSINAL